MSESREFEGGQETTKIYGDKQSHLRGGNGGDRTVLFSGSILMGRGVKSEIRPEKCF